MAARLEGIFDKKLKEEIINSKLLVVGAGGIGCELLKTLVLTGFEDIRIIDLDTIDLSNLNRQFLFHKQHIGRSKAEVAKESVLKFNPNAKIEASHASITSPEYTVQFYRQFTAVLNALDNVAARSHVNRMCMAADVPLIESGSAGYLGQATVYKRNVTECFECLPKKPQKSYPSCTIRNTPSEPVHCIVWAKHLFNQLFGENDADDDVSPDATDPDIVQSENMPPNEGRISTREMAKTSNYDPLKLFEKLFHEDILYLKRMPDLWKKRKAPMPLNYKFLPDAVPGSSQSKETENADFMPWSLKHCGDVFTKCVDELWKRIKEGEPDGVLTWDKDDSVCIDFVVACSNLRANIFHIPQKSKFDIKAIAGNIIPAIATTNAIVAGLIVLQILKLLMSDLSRCRTAWLNETYKTTNKLLSSGQLEKPNPKCLVCSSADPEVQIQLNVDTLTIRTLDDKVLKETLHMILPDVVINDGSGKILISSEPEDMSDEMFEKSLSCFKIASDTRLLCEDFSQCFKIHLVIQHDADVSGQEFFIQSNIEDLKPATEEISNSNSNTKPDSSNSNEDNAGNSDVMDCDDPELEIVPISLVEKDSEDDENSMEPPTKKIKAGQ